LLLSCVAQFIFTFLTLTRFAQANLLARMT
jgi:hypothetical protein